MTEQRMTGIAKAVEIAGGQRPLANKMSKDINDPNGVDTVSQQAVQQWLVAGYVPLERAVQINELTGVAVADLVNPRIIEVLAIDA